MLARTASVQRYDFSSFSSHFASHAAFVGQVSVRWPTCLHTVPISQIRVSSARSQKTPACTVRSITSSFACGYLSSLIERSQEELQQRSDAKTREIESLLHQLDLKKRDVTIQTIFSRAESSGTSRRRHSESPGAHSVFATVRRVMKMAIRSTIIFDTIYIFRKTCRYRSPKVFLEE